jgi:L,D-peptidoglycan transpeptidase YkuD (ErfK/YbiS/YcfS/YnhG family)
MYNVTLRRVGAASEAVSISYPECAALDIQHAKRVRRTAICGLSGSAIFFHAIS